MNERHLEETDASDSAFAGGLWLTDPDGNAINIRNETARPWRGAKTFEINQPGRYRRFERGCPAQHQVRPTRLGHVLLFTSRLDEMIAFYGDVLGLRLSDRVPGIIAFMHAPGGGDHHVLALLKDQQPGFHHASFEVESPDEIGLGAQAVLEAGYRNGWGLGRHVIGSNFFHYIRDPWDSMAEYFCDIDYIPADAGWKPTNYPAEDSLYVWGPKPPEAFGMNFEPV